MLLMPGKGSQVTVDQSKEFSEKLKTELLNDPAGAPLGI